nr:Chain C, peptide from HLA-DPA1 protein [synthetic construct]
EEFGRAASF